MRKVAASLICLVMLGCEEPQGQFDSYVPPPMLHGRACAPGGDYGMFNAVVTASADGGVTVAQTTSDHDGLFEFEGLATGTYTVTVQKASHEATGSAVYTAGTRVDVGDICIDPGNVSIAVMTGLYDSIEVLIEDLGFDVDVYNGINPGGPGDLAMLYDVSAMFEYDVLFFNCGLVETWYDIDALVAANLRAYVENGGSIYVSDWASGLIEAAWPDAVTFAFDGQEFEGVHPLNAPRIGLDGAVEATVLDFTLNQLFGGRTANIYYHLGAWVVIDEASPEVEVLLRGDVTDVAENLWSNRPLAVRWSPGVGAGQVIYTTFHNEDQVNDDMKSILFEFILSL
jgi:hypothetical protein